MARESAQIVRRAVPAALDVLNALTNINLQRWVTLTNSRFTKAFVEQSKALPMGYPMQEGIKLGPLARADLRRNVHRQVQDAVKAGARVLTGSEFPTAQATSIRRQC